MATMMYDSDEDDHDYSHDYDDRGQQRRGRSWTKFEVNTLLGLICKGSHRKDILDLTTELNVALNGASRNYNKDIEMADVEAMMNRIRVEKKGALAFIDRQPGAVITRKQREVFYRDCYDFVGTKEEWEAGRKNRVYEARAMQQQRNLSRMSAPNNLPGLSSLPSSDDYLYQQQPGAEQAITGHVYPMQTTSAIAEAAGVPSMRSTAEEASHTGEPFSRPVVGHAATAEEAVSWSGGFAQRRPVNIEYGPHPMGLDERQVSANEYWAGEDPGAHRASTSLVGYDHGGPSSLQYPAAASASYVSGEGHAAETSWNAARPLSRRPPFRPDDLHELNPLALGGGPDRQSYYRPRPSTSLPAPSRGYMEHAPGPGSVEPSHFRPATRAARSSTLEPGWDDAAAYSDYTTHPPHPGTYSPEH